MRRIVARLLGGVGAGGIVVGCGAMTAMLPGAAASVLGVLGLGGSSVVGRALASASKPLFVVSAVLLIVAGLACSWLAALTAAGGSLLLYLSMFVVLDDDMGSSSMAGMSGMSGRANVPLFWAGSVIVVSFVVSRWRRRQGNSAPVVSLLRQ